jgi:hypothetical protein
MTTLSASQEICDKFNKVNNHYQNTDEIEPPRRKERQDQDIFLAFFASWRFNPVL